MMVLKNLEATMDSRLFWGRKKWLSMDSRVQR